MKLLYPDLVDVAIASSGPVLAKADFFEYLETVSDDFEKYGTPGCFDKIGKIFKKRYEEMLKTTTGIKLLKEEEQICVGTDMNKLQNQQIFLIEKIGIFKTEAQYGDLNSLKKQCELIVRSSLFFSLKDEEIDLWNERVDKGVRKTNYMYGGLRPNVKNVVFVNGEMDPWHRLSILKDISYDAPAIVVPFSSHCKALLFDQPGDPEELKEARRDIKYLVKKWIGAGEL
ncbi:putative serine protease K12H4.7 [Operophtera brumata]|uniref:Putative serine protease K12H4.7 n=1 Tax=Operophtera brumata TaxID=104452 RepID=A0A0L7LD69_OPEBR|nr:putative serine protease K12H4.7 [Operophtera brumata]